MKILLAGGGTLGPVTPLLAVVDAWKKQDSHTSFVWVGTTVGPERPFVEKEGIAFYTLPATRLVRWFSFEWLFLPFVMGWTLILATRILLKEKPDVILSAGGYTAVPLIWVAWLLRIPSWAHQQDISPVLTNRLVAPFVSLITVAWKETVLAFPKAKTQWVGNPVRIFLFEGSKERATTLFGLDPNKPTVFIFGGGTGAQWINECVKHIKNDLMKKANVIHLTGKGKQNGWKSEPGYFVAESIGKEMADAFAVADVVVCRAGLGTITELAALKKAAILIPIPQSAQQRNAQAVQSATIVLSQNETTAKQVQEEIEWLLQDADRRRVFGEQLSHLLPTDVAETLIDRIQTMIKNNPT